MTFNLQLPSPIESLVWEGFGSTIPVWIKRDDLIHPIISGNKWRKLEGFVNYLLQNPECTPISFGGVYSNHLAALGFVLSELRIPGVFFLRGEPSSNPSIDRLVEQGHRLTFVPRLEYKQKESSLLIADYIAQETNPLIIPEGGYHQWAEIGLKSLANELIQASSSTSKKLLCLSAGTGKTYQVLRAYLGEDWTIRVYPAIKGYQPVQTRGLEYHLDSHEGGYGKYSDRQIALMRQFWEATCIKTDPIYTGKLILGVYLDFKNGRMEGFDEVNIYHSGGLQGIDGFEVRFNVKLFS